MEEVLEDPFLKPFFLIQEDFFQSFRAKFLASFYAISLAYKISYFLLPNHSPELRCVICTGVTLFVLVLHLNCTSVTLELGFRQNTDPLTPYKINGKLTCTRLAVSSPSQAFCKPAHLSVFLFASFSNAYENNI